MNEKITLVLDWPPSLNTYRAVSNNKLVTSKDGNEYKHLVQYAVLMQGSPQIFGQVTLTEYFYCKTNARYDIDNFRKASRDCLKKCGVIEDDHLIFEDHGYKMPKDPGNPRVEIVLETWKGYPER